MSDQVSFIRNNDVFVIRRILFFFSICLQFHPAQISLAHELEDGFIEKAMEVVIRDDTATLKYYVGINDNTIDQVVAKWIKKAAPKTKSQPDSIVEKLNFSDLLLQQLSTSIELKINDKPVKLIQKRVYEPGKHHFNWVAEFEFPLANGTNELSLVDQEFRQMKGAARYSLKALGSTMLLKSSVAPIIIRAKRHELNNLGIKPRREICTITATVATTSPVTELDTK